MELRDKIREQVISARILAKTVDEAVDEILLLFDVSKSFESGIDVKIIGKKANHPFDIGEIVTLVEKEKSGLWKAYNENRGNWWIDEEDANVCY
jgi:hypothetical protein